MFRCINRHSYPHTVIPAQAGIHPRQPSFLPPPRHSGASRNPPPPTVIPTLTPTFRPPTPSFRRKPESPRQPSFRPPTPSFRRKPESIPAALIQNPLYPCQPHFYRHSGASRNLSPPPQSNIPHPLYPFYPCHYTPKPSASTPTAVNPPHAPQPAPAASAARSASYPPAYSAPPPGKSPAKSPSSPPGSPQTPNADWRPNLSPAAARR